MLHAYSICCPYCGELFETLIDLTAGNQTYVEDCQICCRPIDFFVTIDPQGSLNVETRRGDD